MNHPPCPAPCGLHRVCVAIAAAVASLSTLSALLLLFAQVDAGAGAVAAVAPLRLASLPCSAEEGCVGRPDSNDEAHWP